MSDNPTTGLEPPERPTTWRCRNGVDHPTSQLPPGRAHPRTPATRHRPGPSPDSAPSSGAPRPMPGPRRRRPHRAGMPPWDSTPVTGIPRVDPAGFGGYYSGPADAPVRSRGFLVPPRARAAHAVSGTVHRHAVASGQTAALGGLAPVALRAVRSADQPGREPAGRAVPRLGGPGEPAAAGLLPRRDGVAEGRRRQNHDHRDAGIHLRLPPRRPGDGGGRQPRPRHPEPEGAAGDGGQRAAAAARRRKPSSATAMSAATPRGARAGWKCWRRKAIRRSRTRSAPTTTPAPWRSWSGSTAWSSPTAAPGCCTRRCHRCWTRPMCSSWSARVRSTARAAPRRRWTGSTRTATRTWCATRSRSSTPCGRGRGKVDMQKVVDHFSRRCRAVRLVPFDPHLEEGAEISLDRLRRSTREALTELAAVVADGFPSDSRPAPGLAAASPRVLTAAGSPDRRRDR